MTEGGTAYKEAKSVEKSKSNGKATMHSKFER